MERDCEKCKYGCLNVDTNAGIDCRCECHIEEILEEDSEEELLKQLTQKEKDFLNGETEELETLHCEDYTEHQPVWAGDGFFCSRCMIPFMPEAQLIKDFSEIVTEIRRKKPPVLRDQIIEEQKRALMGPDIFSQQDFSSILNDIRDTSVEEGYARGLEDCAEIINNKAKQYDR